MKKTKKITAANIKVYHGYGHQHNLIVFGHVLVGKAFVQSRYGTNAVSNALRIVKLFFVRPIPDIQVRLKWGEQEFFTTTGTDGFFKFEWESLESVSAGWHTVLVDLLDSQGYDAAPGEGKIFVPHATQYGFISDIDDTVLVSHSATSRKKLRVLFTKNPLSRKTFSDVVRHYRLLSLAHTTPNVLNPFFYVSSSEWNLYDDLNEFFKHNGLPKGAFLLNQIKKWYQLFKTGNTKHQGKLIRIARIIDAFPKQRFVLLGDNSQQDPEIYVMIANKHPENVVAIYIRNISLKKELPTKVLLESIQNKSIHTCQFIHTDEAILHSKSIGLIS